MFDLLVRDYGGAIVLKEKISKSPDFQNADYLFHFEKVVAELKCMVDDNSDSPSIQAKVNAVMDAYHKEGKISTKEITEDSWRTFPKELHNDIYTITTPSIQARIKKANRQIRETKSKLGLGSYSGMLIIANDGLVSMPPAAFVMSVLKYAKENCSEINYVIFLTANLFTRMRDVPVPTLFWIGIDMENGQKMDEAFTNRLGSSWRGLVSRRTDMPGFVRELHDIEGFWKAKNFKP